ncbi:MAG: hypothetical protein ACNS64_05270 [Candidatus Halalkalibacterium sp. M3_1C_030]
MKAKALKYVLSFLSLMLYVYAGTWQVYAQSLSYNGSAQYATGNYFFTERTGSFYLNNGISVSERGITLSINVPYIIQSSPWISYSSHGLLATGGPGSGTLGSGGRGGMGKGHRIDPGEADTINYSEASFGDPNISASIRLFTSQSRRTSLQGNLDIKFPLADPSNGFGTGAWDFGSGLSLGQRLGSHYILLISGTYWQLGDMEELEFNNTLSYSSGFGRVFAGSKWMLSANIYGYTRILDEVDPPLSSGLTGSVSITEKVQISANLIIGLSESVSDFSTGFGWTVQL